MKIEDKLIQAGLNQTLIEFYHGRTRNKGSEILEIWACPLDWKRRDRREGAEIKAMAKLSGGRLVCYMLDAAKIRNKRLNILMND